MCIHSKKCWETIFLYCCRRRISRWSWQQKCLATLEIHSHCSNLHQLVLFCSFFILLFFLNKTACTLGHSQANFQQIQKVPEQKKQSTDNSRTPLIKSSWLKHHKQIHNTIMVIWPRQPQKQTLQTKSICFSWMVLKKQSTKTMKHFSSSKSIFIGKRKSNDHQWPNWKGNSAVHST